MDASAYLQKQGWRGLGHSLDHSNRGIKKPLLISKKRDALGVGLDKHATVSDQWWLRAFDQGLKSLGTGEQTLLGNVQKNGVKRGDLYGRFVKGDRIAGSIGQTPVGSKETTGVNIPDHFEEDKSAAIAKDVPSREKLENVVGEHADEKHHDAMIHLLEHPEYAPNSMQKMLDKKRKRAEAPKEKRARRKVERDDQAISESSRKREQAEVDIDVAAQSDKVKRAIEKRVKHIVHEAKRRGILDAAPGQTGQADIDDNDMEQVLNQFIRGLEPTKKKANDESGNSDKFAHETRKRDLKRIARAYLLTKHSSNWGLDGLKESRKAEKARKVQEKSEAARREVEEAALREQRKAARIEAKKIRRAEKAGVAEVVKERDAAIEAGKTTDEFYAKLDASGVGRVNGASNHSINDALPSGSESDNGMDEVKFGMNRKGGKEQIPGVGAIDRYPRKTEKKAKKLKAMAIENRISGEGM